MALVGKMNGFITETNGFISEFSNLKSQMCKLHEDNRITSDAASNQSKAGAQKSLIGGILTAVSVVAGAGATVVSFGTAAPFAVAAVVGSVALTADGENDMRAGTATQANVIAKSDYENMEAYKKIEQINKKIQDQKRVFKPVLDQIGKKFDTFVRELEIVNGNKHTIEGVERIIAALKSAKIMINDAFERIELSSSQRDTGNEEENIIMRLARDFGQTSDKLPTIQDLFKLIRKKMGPSDILSEILINIEKLFSQFQSNMRAVRLVNLCGEKIQRFHDENHSVQLIDLILSDLGIIKTQYADIIRQLKEYDCFESAEKSYQQTLADKDSEIEMLKRQLAQSSSY